MCRACGKKKKKKKSQTNAQACLKHTRGYTKGMLMNHAGKTQNDINQRTHIYLTSSSAYIQLFMFHRKSTTSVVVCVIFNAITEPSLIQLPGVFTAVWIDTVRLSSPSFSPFLLELQTFLWGMTPPPPLYVHILHSIVHTVRLSRGCCRKHCGDDSLVF